MNNIGKAIALVLGLTIGGGQAFASESLPKVAQGADNQSYSHQLTVLEHLTTVIKAVAELNSHFERFDQRLQGIEARTLGFEKKFYLVLDKLNAIQPEKLSLVGQRAKDAFTLGINADGEGNQEEALTNFHSVLSHYGLDSHKGKSDALAKEAVKINQEDSPEALAGALFYIGQLNYNRLKEATDNRAYLDLVIEVMRYFELIEKLRVASDSELKIPNKEFYVKSLYYLGKLHYETRKPAPEYRNLWPAAKYFLMVVDEENLEKSLKGVDEGLWQAANFYLGKIYKHQRGKFEENTQKAVQYLTLAANNDLYKNRAKFFLGFIAYGKKEFVAAANHFRWLADHVKVLACTEKDRKMHYRALYYLAEMMLQFGYDGEDAIDKAEAIEHLITVENQSLDQNIKIKARDLKSKQAQRLLEQ